MSRCDVVCRKMYDCIVADSPLLPNGVNLPEVLEGAAESEVREVLASMPEPGQRISAAALVSAGLCTHPESPAAPMHSPQTPADQQMLDMTGVGKSSTPDRALHLFSCAHAVLLMCTCVIVCHGRIQCLLWFRVFEPSCN